MEEGYIKREVILLVNTKVGDTWQSERCSFAEANPKYEAAGRTIFIVDLKERPPVLTGEQINQKAAEKLEKAKEDVKNAEVNMDRPNVEDRPGGLVGWLRRGKGDSRRPTHKQ